MRLLVAESICLAIVILLAAMLVPNVEVADPSELVTILTEKVSEVTQKDIADDLSTSIREFIVHDRQYQFYAFNILGMAAFACGILALITAWVQSLIGRRATLRVILFCELACLGLAILLSGFISLRALGLELDQGHSLASGLVHPLGEKVGREAANELPTVFAPLISKHYEGEFYQFVVTGLVMFLCSSLALGLACNRILKAKK